MLTHFLGNGQPFLFPLLFLILGQGNHLQNSLHVFIPVLAWSFLSHVPHTRDNVLANNQNKTPLSLISFLYRLQNAL